MNYEEFRDKLAGDLQENLYERDLAYVYEKYAEGLITKEESIHQRTLAQEQTEQESKPKQSSVISMQLKTRMRMSFPEN